MAYKQVKKYGYRDSLEKGDPEKVIMGADFDGEFEAIEEAFESIYGGDSGVDPDDAGFEDVVFQNRTADQQVVSKFTFAVDGQEPLTVENTGIWAGVNYVKYVSADTTWKILPGLDVEGDLSVDGSIGATGGISLGGDLTVSGNITIDGGGSIIDGNSQIEEGTVDGEIALWDAGNEKWAGEGGNDPLRYDSTGLHNKFMVWDGQQGQFYYERGPDGAGLKFELGQIVPLGNGDGSKQDDQIDLGETGYRFKNGYFSGEVQAADFLDADGNSIIGSGGGSSLWEQSGDDIYYDVGNVGIGASPDAAGDGLQVAGNISATGTVSAGEINIYTNRIWRTGFSGFQFTDSVRPVGSDGVQTDGELSLGTEDQQFKDAHFSGTVSVNGAVIDRGIYRPEASGAGIRLSNQNSILPADGTGTQQNDLISLGDTGNKFKDAHFSGTVTASQLVFGNKRIYDTASDGIGIYFDGGTDAILPTDNTGNLKSAGPSLGNSTRKFKDAYFSENVTAKDYIVGQNIYRSTSGAGGLKLTTLASIIPTDNTGTNSDGELTLGSAGNRFKDAHFSGTVNAGAFVGDGSGLTGVGGGSGGLPDGGYTYGWSITATDFIATSDERVKDNITTAPVGLIDSLKGREWDWKESGEKGSGVVAQELEQVLPHLVHTDDEGMKSVAYNGLVAYLIEELKDCRQRIADLETKS
jgi:hypothetical protein